MTGATLPLHINLFLACRNNFIFCTTQQLKCANFCCTVCHNICYSYSHSVATFCTTRQFNCSNSCCALYHNICYSYSQSVATFCTSQQFNPLPSLTLQSARDLNVPCRPKRSKALLLTSSPMYCVV